MLAHAVGLAPFKDNFWSTSVQPGNPYSKSDFDERNYSCIIEYKFMEKM